VSALQSFPDVQIIGQAETVSGLEDQFRQQEPDMMVLDIFLRNRCVLEPLRDYLAGHPRVRALTISSYEPQLFARFSRKVGARGFIGKHAPPEEFKKAFRTVAEGGQAWPPELKRPMASAGPSLPDREERMAALTLREMEVFQLLGKWKNTEEIAEELKISSKTVEIHRIHLKQKLGFSAASDLLHFAVEWVEMSRRPGNPGQDRFPTT
jgi:DNA-binding NarL/FixJ family response regulator